MREKAMVAKKMALMLAWRKRVRQQPISLPLFQHLELFYVAFEKRRLLVRTLKQVCLCRVVPLTWLLENFNHQKIRR